MSKNKVVIYETKLEEILYIQSCVQHIVNVSIDQRLIDIDGWLIDGLRLSVDTALVGKSLRRAIQDGDQGFRKGGLIKYSSFQ